MHYRIPIAVALILVSAQVFAARQGGPLPVPLPLFPSNNWWNTDISGAPVAPNSASFITFIGPTKGLHPDFGGDAGGGDIYGFPFIVVNGSQPKKTVTFVFSSESDGVGTPFYPIPDEAITLSGWVEGGQPGNIDQRAVADRHILIVDKTSNTLYELYNVWFNGTAWQAGSGAFFDMKTNNRRPDTWTSADAAGLAILPGLLRYDEVAGPNEIGHALRFTVRATNGYVYPASHAAGSNAAALPMGARLRLKASRDISSYTPDVQKIFRAFKKYGLIVADNGSDMYISGAYDTRWDNGVLNPAFSSLKASDFEVVQLGWQPSASLLITVPQAVGVAAAATLTVTVQDKGYNVLTGYRGTIHFTSTDGTATLPADYTFTAGDNGAHTFAVTLRSPGDQTITVTDTLEATITASRIVSAGPEVPTGVEARAAVSTLVNVSWDASAGAAQYDVERRSATSGYVPLTTTSSTSYADTSVVANGIYIYRVRAVDAVFQQSAFGIPDAATTFTFTDDPLVANVTSIKAVHISELRQAVNVMRAAAGLAAATFIDPVLDSSVRIKAVHLQEVQNALDQARTILGLIPNSYYDATFSAGTTRVQAANVRDLRNGLK